MFEIWAESECILISLGYRALLVRKRYDHRYYNLYYVILIIEFYS